MRYQYTTLLIVLALLEGPALIRRALELAGVSDKEAYLTMGISQPRFSKWMSGVEPMQWNRLTLLPVTFHRWFYFLGALQCGLPEEVAQAEPIRHGLKRMAKMQRTAAETRKVS